jgi:hypothetical protein
MEGDLLGVAAWRAGTRGVAGPAEVNRAKTSRADQGRAGPSWAESQPSRAKPCRAKPKLKPSAPTTSYAVPRPTHPSPSPLPCKIEIILI